MNGVRARFAPDYERALRDHLAGDAESDALARAAEIGRDAMRAGASLGELEQMHCKALFNALGGAHSVDESRAMVRRAGEPLGRLLEPFDEAARWYREARDGLQRRSEELAAKNVELAAAKEKAERESWFKSRFLATMSHELRTPLNAIIGFTELLEQQVGGTLSPRQLEFVGHALSSSRHLLQLVNDVLDLSQIEAGRMNLRREPTALITLIDAAYGVVQPLADKHGITLGVEVPAVLPTVDVDPVRTTQVLYNLLSNAIKFTPAGGTVRIVARVLPDALQVDVTDTGVGLGPDELPRLFREFERIDVRVAGERREGTGLGLALSRRLIELHGGSLGVTSEKGRGSTFSFTLPLSREGA